jgi:hypothetical protein
MQFYSRKYLFHEKYLHLNFGQTHFKSEQTEVDNPPRTLPVAKRFLHTQITVILNTMIMTHDDRNEIWQAPTGLELFACAAAEWQVSELPTQEKPCSGGTWMHII